MADVLHKDLTGADLHEPKGAAAASSGQVYVANGAGSGAWTSLDLPSGTFRVTVTTFTASGTWTKPSNLFAAKVHVVGGGGGGSAGGTTSFGSILSVSGGSLNTGGTIITGGHYFEPGNPGWLTVGGQAAGHSYYGKGGNGPIRAFIDGDHPDFGAVYGGNGTDQRGGGGGYAYGWYTDSQLASSVAVTVGAGGSSAGGSAGNPGVCIIEEFIKVTS